MGIGDGTRYVSGGLRDWYLDYGEYITFEFLYGAKDVNAYFAGYNGDGLFTLTAYDNWSNVISSQVVQAYSTIYVAGGVPLKKFRMEVNNPDTIVYLRFWTFTPLSC